MKRLFSLLSAVVLLISVQAHAQSWNYVGAENALYALYPQNTTVCTDYIGNVYAAGYVEDTLPNGYITFFHFYVAKWNGTRWYELKDNDTATIHYVPPVWSPFLSICTDRSGYLYAITQYSVQKWDGRSWHAPGEGDTAAHFFISQLSSNIVADTAGNIYVGGIFTAQPAADSIVQDSFYMAKWDGVHWSMMDDTFVINKMCVSPDNKLYAIGYYINGSGPSAAMWNGAHWQELRSPLSALTVDNMDAICADGAGNVYVAAFRFATFTIFLTKWDGTTWSNPLFTTNSNIESMVADKNNNIYIAGLFADTFFNYYDVVKYDGTSFTKLGTPFYSPMDWDTGAPWRPHMDGFYSINLDTAGNVYGALWKGQLTKGDSVGPGLYVYTTVADTLSIVRYGTPFPIDTNILPPPDTTDVIYADTLTKTAVINTPSENIKVYPIPTHSVINIDINTTGATPYHIFNAEGRCVASGVFHESHNEVNMSSLPAGTYFLQLGDKRDHTFKVIRE